MFYSSRVFGGGPGVFVGVVSSQLFDAATLSDPVDTNVVIDDLHFGVPAPPTLGLLALAGFTEGDGVVGVADLLLLLAGWGPCPNCDNCPADLDGDCTVGVADLLILFANWG